MTSSGPPTELDTPFGARHYFPIEALQGDYAIDRLPVCLKILLENLLRHADDKNVTDKHIQALAGWNAHAEPEAQIAFTPARVVLQDFTGVPALVDLAALRDAMTALGKDAALINPLVPVDLVIDHSLMVDTFAVPNALDLNTKLEFKRNRERYEFLRWGQDAFDNFRVVPPGTGIVHQVNLEYLADVVTQRDVAGQSLVFPDTLVGTDSHTTMINGLGVLGWGVGGIEAEAAMLGQPITMLIPQVTGFHLYGQLPAGATATDLVLTVTQQLRAHGVVGRFVEFFGDGLSHLTLADRATISNMAPEYGATCGLFPVDAETLRYLSLTGRPDDQVKLVETYARAQGLWREAGQSAAEYTDTLELDLASVVPSIAGPKRPQDRTPLSEARGAFEHFLEQEGKLEPASKAEEDVGSFHSEGGSTAIGASAPATAQSGVSVALDDESFELRDGHVVIAAITSCTNTSNPAILMTAGLVARAARQRGLRRQPWVKTSLAPGSQAVPRYLDNAGLLAPLQELGFDVVGFGCTTCIGNSGPLPEPIRSAINEGNLIVTSVLSGNRNFEGRIHPDVRANYLASPPLVVAYALAGSMRHDLVDEPLGVDDKGKPVYLHELWPDKADIDAAVAEHVSAGLYTDSYADVFEGSSDWKGIAPPASKTYTWPDSSYIRLPPYFEGLSATPAPIEPIRDARCLVKVGDSITTDHISPAGAIRADSPAGEYLRAQGISPGDFNSLGSRRGNHEVMMRGTFANVRLRNQLAPGTEGSATRIQPGGEPMSIFDAGLQYRKAGTPLIVIAGKEYGTGSSRDWAAKGVQLLGVKAVLAESYERIHRSNLVGFGVLPLQFADSESAATWKLDGTEQYTIEAVDDQPEQVKVVATRKSGETVECNMHVRIDTQTEWDYFRHGGILHYVLRDLAARDGASGAEAAG